MNTQTLNMRNIGDLLGQPAEKIVIGCQRIAATKDHLINLLMQPYISKGLLPLLFALSIFLVGEVPAEAVATVDCAVGTNN